jgi:DNA repair protein RecN (Recombination protein N)
MLDELHVANLGIIESATLEPGSGLVAVTGETGAGKTLLLGAL